MYPGGWARWTYRGTEARLGTYVTTSYTTSSTTNLLVLPFTAVILVTRCLTPVLAGGTLSGVVIVVGVAAVAAIARELIMVPTTREVVVIKESTIAREVIGVGETSGETTYAYMIRGCNEGLK